MVLQYMNPAYICPNSTTFAKASLCLGSSLRIHGPGHRNRPPCLGDLVLWKETWSRGEGASVVPKRESTFRAVRGLRVIARKSLDVLSTSREIK